MNSAFSSYLGQGKSDLFTTKIKGTPQFVMRISLFNPISNFLFFSSSDRESFINVPSSSNFGSSNNFILSSTSFKKKK